ncbi:MAG: hypothetical protein ACKO5Q_15815 [Microcystaceae cyanobacterium]
MTEKLDIDTVQETEPMAVALATPEYMGWQAKIADYFDFAFYKTNFRTEILAGITTFMTMAYILVIKVVIPAKISVRKLVL